MHKRFRFTLCVYTVLVLLCAQSFCDAEDIWEHPTGWREYYQTHSEQMYTASEMRFESEIAWTIINDDTDLHVLKRASLRDGKVHEWNIQNEYIIQKDPTEYDGILYAVEDSEQVQIWLMESDASRQCLATYNIAYPYWDKGPQTVRAYMHGTLYYIKSLERIEDDDKNWWHAAVLCSIDSNGNEYTYQLSNEEQPEGAIFHYFAISPTGKVAWTAVAPKGGLVRNEARDIIVEIPGQGVQSVLTNAIVEQMGWDWTDSYPYDGVYSQCLCWLDEDHLLFGRLVDIYAQMYVLDLENRTCAHVVNQAGDPIVMYHSIQGSTGVYYNQKENLIAYMGRPNHVIEWDDNDFRAAVPHIIDLNTGRNYIVYEIKAIADMIGEFRNQAGQLSWMGNTAK